MVFFLLESLNNLVQYQFDGNAPLVYCIIRRRRIFHQLAALPTDETSIDRVRTKRTPKKDRKQRHEKLAQIEREHRESEEKRSPSPTVSSNKSIENLSNEGTPELTLPLGKDIEDPSFSLQGMMIIYITEEFFFKFFIEKKFVKWLS